MFSEIKVRKFCLGTIDPKIVFLSGLSQVLQGFRSLYLPATIFFLRFTIWLLFQIVRREFSFTSPSLISPKKSWGQGTTVPSQRIVKEYHGKVQGLVSWLRSGFFWSNSTLPAQLCAGITRISSNDKERNLSLNLFLTLESIFTSGMSRN